MEGKANIFDHQQLTIQNDKWTIELEYESPCAENRQLLRADYDAILGDDDGGKGDWTGELAIRILEEGTVFRKELIQVNTGGLWLHSFEKNEKSQSVKLNRDDLILSCGSVLLSV